MTGQSLLDRMELVNMELQLQSGEADAARGLVALNVAQDYFESILASEPNTTGSTDVTTAQTSADTETTTLVTTLLRIDSIWKLNSDTFKPEFKLDRLAGVADHIPSVGWRNTLTFTGTPTTGIPKAYWTNNTKIYWSPLPDNTYLYRIYGLVAASDITAGGTFEYKDVVALPLASFAARLMKIGLDDDQTDLGALAEAAFRPVVKALANFNRDGAEPLQYRYQHET